MPAAGGLGLEGSATLFFLGASLFRRRCKRSLCVARRYVFRKHLLGRFFLKGSNQISYERGGVGRRTVRGCKNLRPLEGVFEHLLRQLRYAGPGDDRGPW